MSWIGIHPNISKNEARSLLPPAACKLTVYIFRCFHGTLDSGWDPQLRIPCQRCGVALWPYFELEVAMMSIPQGEFNRQLDELSVRLRKSGKTEQQIATVRTWMEREYQQMER